MRDSIIMTKYQGFGNDYLVLDANKNQLQLQGKKIALLCQRGSGYTKASGTGSCAAAIAAYKKGLMENRINVNQPGGMIQIDIKDDGTIFMTGTVGYIADVSVAESFFS